MKWEFYSNILVDYLTITYAQLGSSIECGLHNSRRNLKNIYNTIKYFSYTFYGGYIESIFPYKNLEAHIAFYSEEGIKYPKNNVAEFGLFMRSMNFCIN